MRVGFVALACATMVAGCGGSGAEDADRYKARLDEMQVTTNLLDMLEDTQGYTQASEMPTTGDARYEGDLGILMGPQGDPRAAFIGDLVLAADFGQGTISGGATNFIGRVDDGATQDFSGTMTIQDGKIGPGNLVTADVGGTLRGGGHQVEVSSFATGLFIGDNAQGIRMVDADAFGELNGATVATQVAIQGQKAD